MCVIEERGHAIETDGAEKLLIIEVPFRTLVYGMSFRRYVPERVIEWHNEIR